MSQKFQRDAASVPSTTKSQEDLCPLCGSKVLYRGLTNIECTGAPLTAVPEGWDYNKSVRIPAIEGKPACPNYKPEAFFIELPKMEIPPFIFVKKWRF